MKVAMNSVNVNKIMAILNSGHKDCVGKIAVDGALHVALGEAISYTKAANAGIALDKLPNINVYYSKCVATGVISAICHEMDKDAA